MKHFPTLTNPECSSRLKLETFHLNPPLFRTIQPYSEIINPGPMATDSSQLSMGLIGMSIPARDNP
jgi:hypothetical protein